MARLYGVLLIIALVIVSGVIAYVGDIVGRRMGRKRLSLFGMRPRHTAIAISVVSGMLITIFTLGAAMALSENVRLGFLRVSQLRSELRELRSTRGRLTEETKTLGARAKELEEGQRAARVELGTTKQSLVTTRDSLTREQANLVKAQAAAKTAVEVAQRMTKRARAAQAEVRTAQDRLLYGQEVAAGVLAAERATPIVLEAQQPLDIMLFEPGLTLPQIRKRVDALLARVDQAVKGVGARPRAGEKQAVAVHHAIVQDKKTGDWAWMPADQALGELAKGIRESDSKTGVVVQAICVRNTHEGEAAPVDFKIFRNDQVFPRGSKLGDVVVGEGLADDGIYDALVRMLREQVGPRGKGRVMPLLKPGSLTSYSRGREYVGDITSKELFAAIERIKDIPGRAHVTAVAKEDVWTIGPLKVELKVEPI